MAKNIKKISLVVCIIMLFNWLSVYLISFSQVHAQESEIKINFQPADSQIPSGYIPDNGEEYGTKNGQVYGWNKNYRNQMIEKDENANKALDTFCKLENDGEWEIELASGNYDVTVSVGEAVYSSVYSSVYGGSLRIPISLNVEDITYWNNTVLDENELIQETKTICVDDGKLTIRKEKEDENYIPINYISIKPIEIFNNYAVKLETTNVNSLWETSRTIAPKYKLYNTGDSPIELQDVKIRYYYSIDGEREQNFWCPWSSVNKDNVTGTFVEKEIPALESDYYFEVGFTEEAGFLEPDKNMKMHTVVAKEYEVENNWFDSIFMKIIEFLNLDKLEEYLGKYIGDINDSDDEVNHEDILYHQKDDYSFNESYYYTEWDKVAVFIDGKLVWGDTKIFGKPQNISTDAEEEQITLSWDALEGATSYDVEVDGTIISNIKDTTYTHSGIQPGTLHKYRVRGVSPAVVGEWSEEYSKWTLPAIPVNIQLSGTSTEITITWDEVIGATGYDVEMYGYNMIIDNGAETQYTHTGLNDNTQKAYRVRAKNTSGVGKWSSVVAESTLPGIPENIKSTALDTSISITWDDVAGATGYDIEVDGTIYENLVGASFLHEGLEPNSDHQYSVRAKNDDGESEWSEVLTVRTLPATPENIQIEATKTTASIMWDAVDGATSYEIEVNGEIIDNGNITTYIHQDLNKNTEYAYRVRVINGELASLWSKEIRVTTLLGSPTNVIATAESTSITVKWDIVAGATGYDIEVDGNIIDNGLSTTYIHDGLIPNTSHTYRIRVRSEGGVSEWSEAITISTLLGMPTNVKATATSTSITVTWDEIEGATGYDILVDGEIMDHGQSTTYLHTDLEPNTLHIYRIRAKSGEYTGEWSEAITIFTIVGIPTNIDIYITSDEIYVSWNSVNGATAYDIGIDDKIIDNGSKTSHTHAGLDPNEEHQYRVRAKNENGTGEWSPFVSQITAPEVPTNLKATATTASITVTWDTVSGATGYDLEVDGEIKSRQSTEYVHDELEPNTRHIYRVRAKNTGGESEWSEALEYNTMPELVINVGKDNIFNFVVVAPKKKGLNTRKIIVNYNPDELEVIDLCAITPQTETEAGRVDNTNIIIEEFLPGRIVYKVDSADRTVVNSIKFLSKINGNKKVKYVIE